MQELIHHETGLVGLHIATYLVENPEGGWAWIPATTLVGNQRSGPLAAFLTANHETEENALQSWLHAGAFLLINCYGGEPNLQTIPFRWQFVNGAFGLALATEVGLSTKMQVTLHFPHSLIL